MDSGQTISFSKELELSAKYALDSAPASSSCQVIVRWVQFADGSTLGDSTFAKELFADRAAILQGLRRLRDAYVNGGSEKFVEPLQERLIRHRPRMLTLAISEMCNKSTGQRQLL
jgi:hypothetical protein